jgi:hypothetical protein
MKRLILLGFTCVTACAGPAPKPDQQAFNAAITATLQCFSDEAQRFDDHQSDALTVAQVLEDACDRQWRESVGPAPKPNQQAFTAAITATLQCFSNEAQRFDDHQSDALTVAQALEGACDRRWQESVRLQEVGMNPYEITIFPQTLRRNGVEDRMATTAVLVERRQREGGS